MKAIILGTERCKFCKIQKKYMEKYFNSDDWLYVDVVASVDNFKIASDIEVDNLPTVILLDKNENEIFRREGTLAVDKIFNIINGNNTSKIPYTNDGISILSYDPALTNGDLVKVCTYNNDQLFEGKVISCLKTKTSRLEKADKKEYLSRGGRKDFCWIIRYKPDS